MNGGAPGDARRRHGSLDGYVRIGAALRLQVRQEASHQTQVDASGKAETHGAVAIKTGGAAELQVGVGAVNVGLPDANFVAPIGQNDRLIVGELHEFVIERDARNVGVDFNGVGLAQASRKT